MNITWKYVKFSLISGLNLFKLRQYDVYMFKYPLLREKNFLYSRDLNRYLNVFKRIFTIWADMSRYVYVNISQYFCRLYDRIWTDMHGMKRAMFLPIRAVTFHQVAAHAHRYRPDSANIAPCIVYCCQYLCISVYMRQYLCISVHIKQLPNMIKWQRNGKSTPFQGFVFTESHMTKTP